MHYQNNIVVKFVRKIGMDGAIIYSSGSRIVAGITGVLSVFFVTSFLTGVEQGFYYTFGSILALQVFFELGLTGIMTQFVAHEVCHLTLNNRFEYEGEEQYKSRLASLIQFCVKWYSILSVVVLVFLLAIGFVYFNRYGIEHGDVNWQTPWMLICIGTSIKLFQSPFNSILIGLGKVKEMSKIGFYQQIIVPACTWLGLICGLKLYVLGIGYLLSVLLWQIYIGSNGLGKTILNLWKTPITERVSYWKEVFPFQWKIAISWISGYFVFQLFNPVLFATEGPVVAGQMGMTLTALNAIKAFSESWMNTKIPLYSKLIAMKDYLNLDLLFNKTLKQMIAVSCVLMLLFLCVIVILNLTEYHFGEHILAERFLTYGPLLLMMVSIVFQQFVSSWAMYLRCHKQEPFMVLSICDGIACLLSTFILGRKFGLYGITIGYCIISIVVIPWAYWIYKTKKTKWHRE